MIQHRVEARVGERQIHEVPAEKLHQVADPALLRMFRRHGDMGLAVGQSGDANAMRFRQGNRRPANAAAGIEHPLSRPKVTPLHQSLVGAQQSLPFVRRVRPPEAEMTGQ